MRAVNKDDLLIGTTRRGGSQGGCWCVSFLVKTSSHFVTSLQQNKALLASVLFQHMIDASVMKSEASLPGTRGLVGEPGFSIMVETFTTLCTQLVFALF